MSPANRPVTIREIADRAQVSVATVSRVLNDQPNVNAEMADRVLAAVRATGYVPNSNGRALRRQRADVWAAIVPDLQNPFFTALISAAQTVAATHGVSIMLCDTAERLDNERQHIRAAIAQRMSGVIMTVASEQQSDLTPFASARVPVVLVDRRVHDFSGDQVLVDNVLAGQRVAEHLVTLGRRRIACLAGPHEVSTTEDRLDGFRSALAACGIGLPPEYVRRSNLRPEGGEVAIRALMALPEPPDAVFVTNGPLTSGAFLGLKRLGCAIPGDVALVGTDDDTWTRMVSPDVSVIQQPVARIGKLAGELLIAHAQESAVAGQSIVLPPVLAVRGSSQQRTGAPV